MKKGSKAYSIVNFKCPRCHEGDLFPTRLLSFKSTFKMNDACNSCDQKYVLEPGFYWGAMYIAYMISSGILLVTFFVLFFGFGIDLVITFSIALLLMLLLYGLIFRLARSIWINLYIRYRDPKKISK
jgi:uncharacterized protein (DUF983 family)